MKRVHRRIEFLIYLYRRFGIRSIVFLAQSKLRKNPCKNIKLHGVRTSINLSNFSFDVTTLFQIFFAKEYDINLPETPKYIVDCGANIGLSSVYFANKYPSSKIIAIEPDESNFKYLLLNTKPYKNIICIQKAVWSRKTKMQLIDVGSGNWGLQTKESSNLLNGSVDTITIDQIMAENAIPSIDLLKIDIEGAEKEIFSSNYQNWLSKTKVIAIELHEFIDKTIKPAFEAAVLPSCSRNYQIGENMICELNFCENEISKS